MEHLVYWWKHSEFRNDSPAIITPIDLIFRVSVRMQISDKSVLWWKYSRVSIYLSFLYLYNIIFQTFPRIGWKEAPDFIGVFGMCKEITVGCFLISRFCHWLPYDRIERCCNSWYFWPFKALVWRFLHWRRCQSQSPILTGTPRNICQYPRFIICNESVC